MKKLIFSIPDEQLPGENVLEVIKREPEGYSLIVERAFVFPTKKDEKRYYSSLVDEMSAWMSKQGLHTDTKTEMELSDEAVFPSIEAAFAALKEYANNI